MTSCSPQRSRSGSLALPHPLPGLRRRRLAFEVFRGHRAVVIPKDRDTTASVAFAPVQSSRFARVGCTDLPLLGFVTGKRFFRTESPSDVAPFIDMAFGVHSRRAFRLCFGDEGATLATCSALVVSHHLDGLLLGRFAGLLHPAADPGVHRVSGASASFALPVRAAHRAEIRLPRDAFHTPRRMFLACSRTTSPWPLPP